MGVGRDRAISLIRATRAPKLDLGIAFDLKSGDGNGEVC